MAPDRDIALADEDVSGGVALNEDLTERIPLVGFDDDDAGIGDADYIGFDAIADDAGGAGGLRQGLGEWSRHAAMATWAAALALFQRLRRRLTGSHLSVRRLRAAVIPAVAVVVAVAVGLALRGWLPARQPERVVAPPVVPPVKSVLVASRPIPRGRILRRTDLEWQPWPATDIKHSYFVEGTRSLRELRGYVARVPIAAGQPVSARDIAAPAGRGFMAAMLRPGMRAVSVSIGPETAASGLILPGDKVDILLSLPVPAFDRNGQVAEHERASAETLLRGIRVLAIDQATAGRAGEAIVGHAATLEVTSKEAEIVTLANELAVRGGMLVLSLRSLRGESAGADGAAAPSTMLDTDVSKLLTDRPVTPPSLAPPLTIVRRGARSQP